MSKKTRHQMRQVTKRAVKLVSKHKPLAAAFVALGGFASSVFRDKELRSGLEDLLSSALRRAVEAIRRSETGGVRSGRWGKRDHDRASSRHGASPDPGAARVTG